MLKYYIKNFFLSKGNKVKLFCTLISERFDVLFLILNAQMWYFGFIKYSSKANSFFKIKLSSMQDTSSYEYFSQ